MAFIGRYKLGDAVPLYVKTVDTNGVATLPDDCPTVKVWNSSGTLILNQKMPIIERFTQTGNFCYPLFLGVLWATGTYTAVYYWTTGSQTFNGLDCDTFEIVDGGNKDGNVIAMYFFDRPQAKYVVYETDSGVLIQGRNPTVQ